MTAPKKSSYWGESVVEESHEERKKTFGYLNLPKGVKTFSLKENTRKVVLDIIPYKVSTDHHPNKKAGVRAEKGMLWYKFPFAIHRNVGGEDESVVCPESLGHKCPICEYQRKRFKEGADKEELTALRAKARNLYNVIPIGSTDHEEVVYVWDMAQSLFQDTLRDAMEDDPGCGIFPSLEEGLSLEVGFKWKKLGKNKYPEAVSIDFLDREPYDEDILNDVVTLEDILVVLSYDELRDKFFSTEDGEDGTLHDVVDADSPTTEAIRSRSRSIANVEEIKKKEAIEEAPVRRSRRAPAPEPVAEEKPARVRRSAPVEQPQEKAPVAKEEEAPPARRRRAPEAAATDNPCPYGHVFGVEIDKHKDCERCNKWDPCMDEYEKGQQ